jgi:hypothetical protein
MAAFVLLTAEVINSAVDKRGLKFYGQHLWNLGYNGSSNLLLVTNNTNGISCRILHHRNYLITVQPEGLIWIWN